MWHVFNYDRYVGGYPTYAKAVFAAQCEIGIDRRPERLHAGFYTLRGETNWYDIATTKKAAVQGFDLDKMRRAA
jgi:hypothetical protein